MMRYLLLSIFITLLPSCVRNKTLPGTQNTIQSEVKTFEVKEVIQTTNYTYLKVKENSQEVWVAVNRQEIQPGEVYYYDNALEMNNFNSKELNRTFDVIYFVSTISKTPVGIGTMEGAGGMPVHSGKLNIEQSGKIKLSKSGNEITIGKLFSDKTEFAGKEIEIRGIVVKVNEGIMDRNWVHIQDGTGGSEGFDLTITTQETVRVNDEVIFKGVVSYSKDFGSGYLYDVIMENAVMLKKLPSDKTM